MIGTKIAFILFILVSAVIFIVNGAAAAAAMVIIAAFYAAVSFLFVMISGRKMNVRVSSDRSCDKGKAGEIKVAVKNESALPVPSATFDVEIENRLTKEKENIGLAYSFGPKAEKKGGFTLTGECCGKERIRVKEALITDPARLFKRKVKVKAEDSIYVMPEVKEISIPSEYLDSYDMESYNYSQHKKGTDPGEVFGIREYRDGDSPKQIHWKLSAKMGDIMVKIPSFPIENKLVVILNNSLSEGEELDKDKRNELMEYFFSLSYSLLKRGFTHSIAWLDHDSGVFEIRRVEHEQDMWACVPEALGAGIEQNRLTTVYRFLAAMGDEHFTNHFVVTSTEVRESERLEAQGAVRVFRV